MRTSCTCMMLCLDQRIIMLAMRSSAAEPSANAAAGLVRVCPLPSLGRHPGTAKLPRPAHLYDLAAKADSQLGLFRVETVFRGRRPQANAAGCHRVLGGGLGQETCHGRRHVRSANNALPGLRSAPGGGASPQAVA